MIRSMTGFGRGKYEIEGRFYTVEIKSVNHKYSDISIRMPKFLNNFENEIRKTITNNITRGKIDVNINFENYSSEGNIIHFNIELAKEYVKGLNELAKETGIKCDLSVIDISKMPEILKVEAEENEDKIKEELMISLNEALQNFVNSHY